MGYEFTHTKKESVGDDHESGEALPEETGEPSREIAGRIELYRRLEALENKEN